MAQITYTNKVALNENPEIADINKVTDDDMNEIKQVVNDNYNNTIQITDTQPTDSDNKIWIDTGEVSSAASEITNEYSTSTGLGYSANYVNNLHTYSTNEVRVGTWIDGKPIYRQCFAFNKSSAGDALITTITNLDVIVNVNTYIKRSDSSGQYKNINNFFSTSTDMFNVYVSFNQIRCSSPYMGTVYGVLEYTKTTD